MSKKPITLNLDETVIDQITKAAADDNRSVSSYVNQLLTGGTKYAPIDDYERYRNDREYSANVAESLGITDADARNYTVITAYAAVMQSWLLIALHRGDLVSG